MNSLGTSSPSRGLLVGWHEHLGRLVPGALAMSPRAALMYYLVDDYALLKQPSATLRI